MTRPGKNAVESEMRPSKSGLGTSLENYNTTIGYWIPDTRSGSVQM